MFIGSMLKGGFSGLLKGLGKSYQSKLTQPTPGGGPNVFSMARKMYTTYTGKNRNGATKGSSAAYNEPYYTE